MVNLPGPVLVRSEPRPYQWAGSPIGRGAGLFRIRLSPQAQNAATCRVESSPFSCLTLVQFRPPAYRSSRTHRGSRLTAGRGNLKLTGDVKRRISARRTALAATRCPIIGYESGTTFSFSLEVTP